MRALILVVLAACSAASAQPGSGSTAVDAGVDPEIDAAFIGPLLPGAYPVDAGVDAAPDAAIAIDAGVVVLLGDARVDRESPSLDLHTASTAGADEEPADAVSSSLFAIKVIGGLVALLVLAYLGGHRSVVRFQERLGISGVITAGLPVHRLGPHRELAVDRHPQRRGARRDSSRSCISGSAGSASSSARSSTSACSIACRKGTAYLILVEALGPFGITATACGAVMIAFGVSWNDPTPVARRDPARCCSRDDRATQVPRVREPQAGTRVAASTCCSVSSTSWSA